MHDPHHETPDQQQEMTTPAPTSAARYPAGPSNGRSSGDASAPGVAEAGRQGAPEENQPAARLPRAAEAAALHRLARRRRRDPGGQRKERVDVRWSVEEKADILAESAGMNIAAAHYVGAVVMAHLHGEMTLPGQRTELDDYLDELNALRGEVARIGHNINQIARKLNSGGDPHPGDTAILAQTEATLTTIATTVRHIATAANQALTTGAAR